MEIMVIPIILLLELGLTFIKEEEEMILQRL